MVTSDDHPGIHPAIKKHYPCAVWQRCQRPFSVNATDLVPKSMRDELYQRLKDAWDCKKYTDAQAAMDQIAPVEHHKRLRTTNMLERVNQELKRRSEVVRIFPNPKSCLRLFTALLKEWHEDWAYGRIYWKSLRQRNELNSRSVLRLLNQIL